MNDKKLIISGKKFRGETSVVSVRLPNDMIEKLDEIAEEIGISQAQVSRLEKGALERIKRQI